MFGPFNPLDESISGKLVKNVLAELFDEMKPQKSNLEYGDVIYVQRVGYKHFGVYIGKNRVIHYAHDTNGVLCVHEASLDRFLDGDSGLYACDFPKTHGRPTPIVISKCLASPSYNLLGMWLKNNKNGDYHLYSPQETVKRAKQRLGETEYNLITNNCEHFALWCKTGVHESHQVDDIIDAINGKPIYV